MIYESRYGRSNGCACRAFGSVAKTAYLRSQVEAFLRGVPGPGGTVVRFPLERTRGNAA